jgi:hypothetical protein
VYIYIYIYIYIDLYVCVLGHIKVMNYSGLNILDPQMEYQTVGSVCNYPEISNIAL